MEIKIHLTNDKFKKLVENGRVQFDLHNEDEGHCVVNVTKINPVTVPNFLQVRIGNSPETITVAVKNISEEELREVGRQFTEDLVAKSKR